MNPVWTIDYLLPVLAAVWIVGVYGAWRSAVSAASPLRWGLTGLRAAALGLLALIALNPGRWVVPDQERDSEWVILLDRSASMAVDANSGESRWKAALRIAQSARERDVRPERVRVYPFAERLEEGRDRPTDRAGLSPDGASTDIRRALNDVLDTYDRSRRELDGILLLSDGRQIRGPEGPDPALRARSIGAPIFVVPLGGEVERRDLSLSAVRRHIIGFAGQSVRLQARAINKGLGDIRPDFQLLAADGSVLETAPAYIPNNGEALVEFEWAGGQAGYEEYEIVAPDWPGETSSADNRLRIACTLLAEPIRILMVEGVPHWDSKFLLQLLRAQPYMRVTTVHRVTGARFFLTEMDTMSQADDRTVFPSTAAELNAYDLVIFGKGAEYFLNEDRVRLLRHFVEDRGGAILFARGKPYAGTFSEMEPLEPIEWGGLVRRPFRWRPTPAAEASGLFGPLLPGRQDERWVSMPAAEMAYHPRRLKPFTQVLMEGVFTDGASGGAFPTLATRRLGKGLSAVVNSEDLWRWDFIPAREGVSEMYKQFWTMLAQWLAVQSDFLPGQPYSLQLSHAAVAPGTAVKATVRARADDAKSDEPPLLRVRKGDKDVREWRPRGTVDGEWIAVFALDEPGTYRVEALADEATQEGGAYATLEIEAPPHESMDLSADAAYLEELAVRSGGRTLSEEEAVDLAERFRPERHAVEMADPIWVTRWDRAGYALLLAALFCGEWFLRRRNGMM